MGPRDANVPHLYRSRHLKIFHTQSSSYGSPGIQAKLGAAASIALSWVSFGRSFVAREWNGKSASKHAPSTPRATALDSNHTLQTGFMNKVKTFNWWLLRDGESVALLKLNVCMCRRFHKCPTGDPSRWTTTTEEITRQSINLQPSSAPLHSSHTILKQRRWFTIIITQLSSCGALVLLLLLFTCSPSALVAEQFPKKDNATQCEPDSENKKGRLDVDQWQSLSRVLVVNC